MGRTLWGDSLLVVVVKRRVLASLPLLSLAACSGEPTEPAETASEDPSGGDTGGSVPDPADDEDPTTGGTGGTDETSGVMHDPEAVAICEAYESVYDACLFPQYAEEQFCDDYTLDLLRGDGACPQAWRDMFVCLSETDCGTLSDPSAFPCRSAYGDAHERCPEAFGFCATQDHSLDDGSCHAAFGRCVDGSDYRIDCVADGAASTCTCTTDGQSSGSFEVPTHSPECYGIAYRSGAEDVCGFPQGLVSLE